MTIKQDLIPVGKGVRTGRKLTKCLGLVIHWIGVCQSKASVIRENFELRDFCGTQYICDYNTGDIIQCVPEDEAAYHVGATKYTDLKKKLVGGNNPNWYFVGIECCIGDKSIPADWSATGKHMELGRPSDVQYEALVEFAADFLTRHGLTTDNLYRHYDITGKLCPVWFCKDFDRWERFKRDVAERMEKTDCHGPDGPRNDGEEIDMTEEEVQALIEAAKPQVYTELDKVPKWARETVKRAMRTQSKDDPEGVMLIQGDGSGKLHLTDQDLKDLERMRKAGLLNE